ncbi:MAG: hypothetical protein MZW92_11470 [Comamonadaceae bacterium]|nr:hypothetical protein [Comamonadaceae bacterium]
MAELDEHDSLAWSALVRGVAAAQAAPVEGDRIVAVVNDEVITASRTAIAPARRSSSQLRQQNIAAAGRATCCERQVLERMIIDRAQLQTRARDRRAGRRRHASTRRSARIAEQNRHGACRSSARALETGRRQLRPLPRGRCATTSS